MKRLRWYDYLTINLFWLGLNIRNTALGSIFMPYLVGIFAPEAIKNTALGGMRSAGLVIAMLVQPAAGLLSDRSTSRWGRRRPYILVGALFDCLFLLAIALSQTYWALLISVLLIQFSSNISHGPLQGLIPDLVPDDQRGRASAVKAIMELLPVILVGLTIAKMVGNGNLDLAIFVTGASLAGGHAHHGDLRQGDTAGRETNDPVLAADDPRAGHAGGNSNRCAGGAGWRRAGGRTGWADHPGICSKGDRFVSGSGGGRCNSHGRGGGGGGMGRLPGHHWERGAQTIRVRLVDRQPVDVPGGGHVHPGFHLLFPDVRLQAEQRGCLQSHRHHHLHHRRIYRADGACQRLDLG